MLLPADRQIADTGRGGVSEGHEGSATEHGIINTLGGTPDVGRGAQKGRKWTATIRARAEPFGVRPFLPDFGGLPVKID